VTGVYGAGEFNEFYRRNYQGVVRHALWLTGSIEGAEDLAQEAFQAAYKRWDMVRSLDWPRGWLLKVVDNQSRSLRRRIELDLRVRPRLNASEPTSLVIDDSQLLLWEVVRRLPRRQAQAVALHYGSGLAVDQCAALMRCSNDTVKTHLKRARKHIAGVLTDDQSGS
jgi:RNA polymerase sigma-70 factor (ECF subfamily)